MLTFGSTLMQIQNKDQIVYLTLNSPLWESWHYNQMKRAISLLLLTVLITSITFVHEGGEYGQRQEKGSDCQEEDSKDYGAGKSKGRGRGYVLTFQHAARDGLWNQDSNRFSVTFNGKTVKSFLPTDYKIHKASFKLNGRKGKNTIHFIAEGVSDSYGSQIDNVKLVSGNKNYIKNGGFEEGHHLGFDDITGWLIFKNGEVRGWHCVDQMEIGWGRIYNSRWPFHNHVCQLDALRNSDIFQSFNA